MKPGSPDLSGEILVFLGKILQDMETETTNMKNKARTNEGMEKICQVKLILSMERRNLFKCEKKSDRKQQR